MMATGVTGAGGVMIPVAFGGGDPLGVGKFGGANGLGVGRIGMPVGGVIGLGRGAVPPGRVVVMVFGVAALFGPPVAVRTGGGGSLVSRLVNRKYPVVPTPARTST